MRITQFIYSVVLKPKPLKKLANAILLKIIPKALRVGEALICLNPQDPVVSGALTLRIFEREELAFFRRTLGPGMTMIDVGANVGLYTALAMHLVSSKTKQGKIVAIEPHEESFRYLSRTMEANTALLSPHQRYPEVHLAQLAASDAEGSATLFRNPDNKADNRLHPSELTPSSNRNADC